MSKRTEQHGKPSDATKRTERDAAAACEAQSSANRPESASPQSAPSDAAAKAEDQATATASPANEGQPQTPGKQTLLEDDIQSQLAAARDRELRLLAELDNFRKRTEREFAEERKYAALPLMRDLLPVLDNLFRAIEAARNTPGAEAIVRGMELVAEQLETVLKKHHCVRIDAQGAPFDPHQHEAIAQQPSSDTPAQHVSAVALHGFRLHDRVVRPSQVVVSSGPPAAINADPDNDSQGRPAATETGETAD